MAGEEEEYNSDPEGTIRSLAMRRREASDDEDGSAEDAEEKLPSHARANDDSDGQGGVEDYDDDEGEELYDVEDDEGLSDAEEYPGNRGHFAGGSSLDAEAIGDEEVEELDPVKGIMDAGPVIQVTGDVGNAAGANENEPYAVPTAGAFYMHDDRFRNSAKGRHKRIFGGRKLWESKDERKWGHDKFEEMSSREGRSNSNGRRGSYNYRGQTRNARSGGGNRSANPRGVRGRGPKRYDHLYNKDKHEKPAEKTMTTTNPPATKQAFTSSLSSASPPFYPSSAASPQRVRDHPDEIDVTRLSIEGSIPRGAGSGLMFIQPAAGHGPLNLASLNQTPLARQMFAQSRAGGALLPPKISEAESSSSERELLRFKGTLGNPPGTPAILPVMQFAGQHHASGLGVPAVGMAFPGYVTRPPQPGLPSSEMAWLPVLAEGTAAGGGFPPYLAAAVDGALRESSGNNDNSNNTGVSSPNPERASDGGEQNRPHKPPPRRYSAMSFGR